MSRYSFDLPFSDDSECLILRIAYGYDRLPYSGIFYQEYLILDDEIVDQITDLDTRWGADVDDIWHSLIVFNSSQVSRYHLVAIRHSQPF